MKKRVLVAFFALVAAMQVSACGSIKFEVTGPRTNVGASATVDNKTVGSSKVKTKDNGKASFNVGDGHVELTNIEFDIPEDYSVDVEIIKDEFVHNRMVLTEDGEHILTALEGTYSEPITKENFTKIGNKIILPIFQPDEKIKDFKVEEGLE